MTDQETIELMARTLLNIQQVLAPRVEWIGKMYDGSIGDLPGEVEGCLHCYKKACEVLKETGMPMDRPVFPKKEPEPVATQTFRPNLPE